MDHPLMTHLIFVDKGNRDSAAWLDPMLVFTHSKNGAGKPGSKAGPRNNFDAVISAYFFTIFWQVMMVAVHNHACFIQGHIVMSMAFVRILILRLKRTDDNEH